MEHPNLALFKDFSMLLLGAGVGYATGVLLAPRAGNHTRGNPRAKAVESLDFLHQRGRELRDRASQTAERGINAFTRQEGVKAALGAGGQACRREIGREIAGA